MADGATRERTKYKRVTDDEASFRGTADVQKAHLQLVPKPTLKPNEEWGDSWKDFTENAPGDAITGNEGETAMDPWQERYFDQLNEKFTDIKSSLSEMKQEVARSEQRNSENVTRALEEIRHLEQARQRELLAANQRMEQLVAELNKRMDTAMTKMDSSVDKVDSRVDMAMTRLDGVVAKVDSRSYISMWSIVIALFVGVGGLIATTIWGIVNLLPHGTVPR